MHKLLRVVKHYDIVLPSLHSFVSFIFNIQGFEFFLFLLKLHSLQNYENTKTLNYGQKVGSVQLP
jgi:hypothetical protein